MLRLTKLIIVMTLLTPSTLWANETAIKEAVLQYQKGFDGQDKDLIEKVSTQKHFNTLNKNKLLDRLFQVNKKVKNKKYKVKVTQSKVVKGMIIAHIEPAEHNHKHNHSHNDEDHKTLSLIKTDDGYKIDSFVHMD